jgi:hypothetical protein
MCFLKFLNIDEDDEEDGNEELKMMNKLCVFYLLNNYLIKKLLMTCIINMSTRCCHIINNKATLTKLILKWGGGLKLKEN